MGTKTEERPKGPGVKTVLVRIFFTAVRVICLPFSLSPPVVVDEAGKFSLTSTYLDQMGLDQRSSPFFGVKCSASFLRMLLETKQRQ